MSEARQTTLTYFVDDMDCANCVKKVEAATSRLPGAQVRRTSFTTQILEVDLDETQTPRSTLEKNLRDMGYAPSLKAENGQEQRVQSTTPDLAHSHAEHQHAGHVHEHEKGPWHQTRQGKLVIQSGLLLAVAYLLGFGLPAFSKWFYIAATLIGVWPLLKKAVASARLGDPFSINMLVSVAALSSLLIGAEAEGAVVVFFFAIGELLEGVAAGRARQSIKALAALAPKTATVMENGQAREVPAASLQVGQVVRVSPGGRIPADGTILEGESSIDDSPVTGESMPVNKGVNSPVFAGSINLEAVLLVRVDRAAKDNTIARIIRMVEEAEESKAPTARFIDRFSRYYTPLVVLAAALTALVPPVLMGENWLDWIYKGISILLIGCPCALVLSTPAAITSGIASGARRGLLIKGGAALESLGTVKTVAFDKTGTLTRNRPQVTDVIPLEGTAEQNILLAAAVEQGSNHPLAKAILEKAGTQTLPQAQQARALQGKGVSALLDGVLHQVTSPNHASTLTDLSPFRDQITSLEEQGKTVVVLLREQTPLALIAIRDEPREDARSAIQELKQLGVQAVMLTGDNTRTGQAIARELDMEVQAELLPENKLQVIRSRKEQGGVAMVGDGINDAPALAESTVGIAMGGGTEVALETADAALLKNQARDVPALIVLSRRTMGNIKQNITFALGLKAVFLVTTLMGYTNLWMAILADTGATMIVTANALRLLRK
ncbi:heavy metal translocating P-type ATPase [Deinococcus cellulosilyticus]|uniref:ATPase n=1 Tax=Deinococcus cellulosilyticus (strain DSM 18568 / NBRC 106333 / KACC 11606 / 5516J-15) TaxID=1223518 RepID=A0A511MVH3_DEIC1|nr:heavy metal translocating P-type ATPase [Deinococcus cellulosilyticus]GEM44575.1 ATPase [Deinococcus cellulosilyticus NBRC 106333 = KACC 11606]